VRKGFSHPEPKRVLNGTDSPHRVVSNDYARRLRPFKAVELIEFLAEEVRTLG